MPLHKGQTNNANGRPKGAKNTIGKELRANISNFCNANFSKIQKDFENITAPEKRIKLYIDFLKYVLPTLQVNKINKVETEPDYLKWKKENEKLESMSEEELQKLLEENYEKIMN